MSKTTLFALIGVSVFAILLGGLAFFTFHPPDIQNIASRNTAPIQTNLLSLSVKKIRFLPYDGFLYNLNRDNLVRGGSIISVKKNILIQRDLRFFYLDLKTEKLSQIKIAPPENGLQKMRAHLGIRRYVATDLPKIKTEHLHYQSILAIERAKTIILLIAYNYWNAENACYSVRLARTEFPAGQSPRQWKATAQEWKVIFETKPCIQLTDHQYHYRGNQSGGRMIASDRPQHILLTVGDYGCDGQSKKDWDILQNENSDYGRILEINIDTGQKTKISIGHRNPQGIIRDGQGRIWSTEHGPQGGDELNLIQKGKNYGWPFVTYGVDYGNTVWPLSKKQGRHDDYEKPIYAFVPSIGISNLTFIRDFAPEWNGDLLIASLGAQTLYRVRIEGTRVLLVEPIPIGHRVRFIHNHGMGTLIALGDKKDILIIKRQSHGQPPAAAEISAPPEIAEAVQAVWKNCLTCHRPAANDYAPSLSGVFGREIGKSEFTNYSPALANAKGRWTEKRLRAFLKNSEAVFEGTSMPPTGIQDPRIIKAIVDHLEKIK